MLSLLREKFVDVNELVLSRRRKIMGRDWRSFLNRYGIVAAAFSLVGFGLVLILSRARDLGGVAVLFGVVFIVIALFLLRVYLAHPHR
jgi:hypothetical protein